MVLVVDGRNKDLNHKDTKALSDERLEHLQAMVDASTPGTWRWFGNARCQNIYLATVERGRQLIMQFKRWGTQSAQPTFQVHDEKGDGWMLPSVEVLQFEVGDRDIVGYGAANKHGSVYRYDIEGINHPDAKLIQESRTAISELLDEVRRLKELTPGSFVSSCLSGEKSRTQGER